MCARPPSAAARARFHCETRRNAGPPSPIRESPAAASSSPVLRRGMWLRTALGCKGRRGAGAGNNAGEWGKAGGETVRHKNTGPCFRGAGPAEGLAMRRVPHALQLMAAAYGIPPSAWPSAWLPRLTRLGPQHSALGYGTARKQTPQTVSHLSPPRAGGAAAQTAHCAPRLVPPMTCRGPGTEPPCGRKASVVTSRRGPGTGLGPLRSGVQTRRAARQTYRHWASHPPKAPGLPELAKSSHMRCSMPLTYCHRGPAAKPGAARCHTHARAGGKIQD